LEESAPTIFQILSDWGAGATDELAIQSYRQLWAIQYRAAQKKPENLITRCSRTGDVPS